MGFCFRFSQSGQDLTNFPKVPCQPGWDLTESSKVLLSLEGIFTVQIFHLVANLN